MNDYAVTDKKSYALQQFFGHGLKSVLKCYVLLRKYLEHQLIIFIMDAKDDNAH